MISLPSRCQRGTDSAEASGKKQTSDDEGHSSHPVRIPLALCISRLETYITMVTYTVFF
jgi:hypothetical protein